MDGQIFTIKQLEGTYCETQRTCITHQERKKCKQEPRDGNREGAETTSES